MSHTASTRPTSLLLNSIIRLTKSLLPNQATQLDPLSFSSQRCASWRAMETNSEQPLISDPYAETLAGPVALARAKKLGQPRHPRLSVRTRYFDDFATKALVQRHQLVVLGAGMDMRAYRLPCVTENTKVFEIDVDSVIDLKEKLLSNMKPSPKPKGSLTRVRADVTADWAEKLCNASFHPDESSVWLVEGLVYYLDQQQVDRLFSQIYQLSGPGSVMCVSAVTRLKEGLKGLAGMFKSSMPDPKGYLRGFGFEVENIVELGGPDANYGRWPDPTKEGVNKGATIFVIAYKPCTSELGESHTYR